MLLGTKLVLLSHCVGFDPRTTLVEGRTSQRRQVDVFSFALVLWELFHTSFPYELELPGADSQV